MPRRRLGCLVALGIILAGSARAEWLAPLATETAETIPAATAQIGIGFAYDNDGRYPGFTPPSEIKWQSLTTAPALALRIAPSDWVEIQLSYEFLNNDQRTVSLGKQNNYGGGDARLFTKVWAVRERTWIPALGVRFGTKLPNADAKDRLGTDETDFFIQLLGSKRFGDWAGHVNLGIALLGNPGFYGADSSGQDDLFTYDLALTSPYLGAQAEDRWGLRGLLEFAGSTGSRFDNDYNLVRAGPQVTIGGWTMFLGATGGIDGAAPTYGFSGGVFYSFELERLAALFD
ncbi:hypothetical protein KF840_25230 [bacterium]|nr:hypothetical protein [bacterium]